MNGTNPNNNKAPQIPTDPASHASFFEAYSEDVAANARNSGLPVLAAVARLAFRSAELSPLTLRDYLHSLDTATDAFRADKLEIDEALGYAAGILAAVNPARHQALIDYAVVHEPHMPARI